jgi:hypothetical protein
MFPQVVQVICTAGALSAWKLWSRSPKVVSIRSTLRRFVFGPLHVENLKVLRLCGTAWRATLPSATRYGLLQLLGSGQAALFRHVRLLCAFAVAGHLTRHAERYSRLLVEPEVSPAHWRGFRVADGPFLRTFYCPPCEV